MSSSIEVQRICENCGELFIAKTTVTRYCSHKCNQRHYKKRKRAEKLKEHQQVQKVVQLQLPDADYEKLGQKEFLSIKETAILLGVSERTLYRLMSNGTLPVHKLGRRPILKRSEIDQLF